MNVTPINLRKNFTFLDIAEVMSLDNLVTLGKPDLKLIDDELNSVKNNLENREAMHTLRSKAETKV